MISRKLFKNLLIASHLSVASAWAATDNSMPKMDADSYMKSAQVEIKLGTLSNKKIDVILQIPSQEAYGFAGKAETPEQNAIADSVIDNLKQHVSTIVYAPPTLDCKYHINSVDKFATAKTKYAETTKESKIKVSEEYTVLKLDVTLKCLKELPKQTINIDVSKEFKSVNQIVVELKSKEKRRFVINGGSGSFAL
jgi:hypothetical protein